MTEEWPDIAATYDAVAADYAAAFSAELAGKPFDRALLDRYAAAVAGDRDQPNLVWDVGCGPAHVAQYLARRGVAVAGVDLSWPMLAAATGTAPATPLVQADMRALPARSGSLAGVVAFYSLIHLKRLEAPAALAEFHRVLRPGGSLLLAVHGGAGEIGAERWLDHEVAIRVTLFGARELAAWLRVAGFEVVEVTTRAPYGSEYPTQRLYLWARRPGERADTRAVGPRGAQEGVIAPPRQRG